MGKRRAPATRRLRLHRETVRTLADRDLTGVGGGTVFVISVNVSVKNDGGETMPRSNAWTGEGILWGCN